MPTRAFAVLACAVVVAIIALMAYFIHSQVEANKLVVSDLKTIQEQLSAESQRSRELAIQVSELSNSIAQLQRDNAALRREIAALKSRPAPSVAAVLPPVTIDAHAIAPYSEFTGGVAPDRYVAFVPITWNSDWTAYQPAGIVAPPFSVGAKRALTDPNLFKTMLIGYGVLQAADLTTTIVALLRGSSREANPLLAPIARHNVPLIATKIGGSIASAIVVNKLRDKNPIIASATLIAINATLAAVVVNNISVMSR